MLVILSGRRIAACLLAAALAAPLSATAQPLVMVERTNVQTAPGHFTSAITVLQGAAPQVVRLGEQGLTRAIFWNDAALGDWAGRTFGGRGVVYVEPDIPETDQD